LHHPASRGTFAFLTGTVEAPRKEMKKIKGLKIHALKPRGETMIRTENLRSAFTKDDVDEYLYKLLPERDAVVREMEDYAAEHGVPIIGPAVARLLSLLVQVSGAKRIFEMGSAIGYSTIWLARAAGPKGKVFYTDGDPEKVHRAQMYFRMAGVAKRIEVQIGDALAIVKKTPGMFDVIFIDVDKNQYPAALHAVRPKLRRGGLLITDNTIWSGKAARPAPEEDKDTKGVQEFNRMVYASKELYPVLIPLRDGLTICRKS
jgi:predicted O-methyltransferase YrrM